MDQLRKNKVSLRGASTGEISRDDLLAKVSQERELRSYARRANAAALFIQRVWRSYIVRKRAALELREEWEILLNHHAGSVTRSWVSSSVLRPFLFFIRSLSVQYQKIQARDISCTQTCFKNLLESMNSNDPNCNFCLLAVGTLEERRAWACQTRKLVSLCAFLLTECNKSHERIKDVIVVNALALRILVVLTDPKSWKGITKDNFKDAEIAGKMLILFLGARRSGYYTAVRRYFLTLNKQMDDRLLITTSAVTLAIRPFHMRESDFVDGDQPDIILSVEEYIASVLTIPRLTQCLPSALICALKHRTVLTPIFRTSLTSWDKVLTRLLEIGRAEKQSPSSMVIPPVGWALGNIIYLATVSENGFVDPQGSIPHMFYVSYVHAAMTLAENFLSRLENVGNQDIHRDFEASADESGAGENSIKISYLELLRPICQQWHLVKLLAASRKDTPVITEKSASLGNQEGSEKLELSDIARFYSSMLRIFGVLNHVGSLPVLNMLSFCPGFLVSLWSSLESLLLPENVHTAGNSSRSSTESSLNKRRVSEKKVKSPKNDGVNKLVDVLNKFAGKSQAMHYDMNLARGQPESSQVNEEPTNTVWDVETLRGGPLGLSKDVSCLLHLFCATYSHLLLVLDDIEFYEKQVPFVLEKQRRISAVLNTLVYNGLLRGTSPENRQFMDSAVRCLHLLYERDCRHSFCPPALWLSPGRTNRPPIAVAARTHEVVSANDVLTSPSMGSVITITPHVFPFEERVHVFREFISVDKASRKMAGEVDAPGSRSIEIVVRRGHVVEDGFRQLNSIGSKLKSSIHVSFVNESGLPEAGLDYGGLSKEFLTDITKAAFAPEYGLFSQTPTSERLLVPSPSAQHLEDGIQMIEFLGRIVGKALYEGILLDYSFSHVFIQKLLGRYSFLDELSGLDPELYRNLVYIKHYDGDVIELCLDFTVTEEYFGKRSIIELKPGGKDISVTNENKMQYIHAMADHKLNRQILPFSNAFYRGLTDLISPSWLKLFNAHEFNQLLSGGNHDIDVDDLRNNTKYTGGYSESSRTIKIFWEVMKGFEPSERCMVLKFVTSCSRAPLLGFKYLQPTFTIHKVSCDTSLWAAIGGQDVGRLPSASTCYNTLKLPTYKRASNMREKLLYAISSNAGFELS
ncbi:PREDICTED: E3 ubiquitin-protein ligase UPL7 [Tarenaya hassleriana]|uniref:E3 ubiquitin-protein ligase UPL7 n=1 Tax=Tarenaya hassleriana TaxID=28532 RepID=UPI00053C9AD6|nr:PREDICTED: E3 ubiquitin-protein ligase UPL7 [Tarenaya hassleriana]XP_010558980.1 PREDICTED: E3 ubiquitin-protein ligase UPL7 [Tarenaya hassleriana]